MRNVILLNLSLLIAFVSSAQYNSRPSRSRFYNSKISTFTVKAGDILLYSVNKNQEQFDLIVTVKKFGPGLTYTYDIPDKKATGTVVLQPGTVINAVVYDTLAYGATKNHKDTNTFWLSKKNYSDLAAVKETTMDLGSGKETFKRQRVHTLKFKYKGKEKIVTVFGIESSTGETKKAFSVLSEENNPLIVKMDAGWSFTLKEVR